MAFFSLAQRRIRFFAIAVPIGLVLLAGYLMLLNREEHDIEQHYSDLRSSNVELYLEKIQQARGFRTYLTEFLAVHDYSVPQKVPPGFLVGRWALFDEAKRVGDNFLPTSCFSGLEFEDGLFKSFGKTVTEQPATYTIDNSQVTVHLADGKSATVELVSFGTHLHHIEVRLPGSQKTYYGYMCR